MFPGTRILESEPGLASARNFALKHISGEIVTFFDDDVTVNRDFFTNLDEIFFHHSELVGTAPRIANLYLRRPAARVFKRLSWSYKFLSSLNFLFYGKITRWGTNHWFPDLYSHSQNCEWLPGCCMSYRRERISEFTFNEFLQEGPTGGYALGEDVDFSMRAATSGLLMFNAKDVITHHQAPSVRDNSNVMELARGFWVGYLCLNYPKRFSKVSVFFYNILRMFIFFVKNLTKRRKMKTNFIFFKGFLRQLSEKKVGLAPNPSSFGFKNNKSEYS